MKRLFKSVVLFLLIGSINILAYAAEPDAPKTGDLLDKVVTYTKQFYEAALPVAKKAYEIGLLTLQIDAIASLTYAALAMVGCGLLTYLWYRLFKYDVSLKSNAMNKGLATGVGFLCWVFGGGFLFLKWACDLFSVWLWVKLFHPDLWLAHMAIEAAAKKLTGS